MMYTEGAPGSNVPFDMVFRGTKGDKVFWAIGITAGPPVVVPGYVYGLRVGTAPVFLVSTMSITRADGEARISFPATPYPIQIFVQGLFMSTNPSYAPGSFSNLLVL